MARKDFREEKEELNGIGIMKVPADFYQMPDSKGFVTSLATPDKARSLKLYSASNTFCDFTNGRQGGDIINFISYIRGINNWESMTYRLDILCCADMATYRRMKPNVELGLSSDCPEWLLDTLAILAEAGAFKATAAKLSEIKAQRGVELKRKPGADRRCANAW